MCQLSHFHSVFSTPAFDVYEFYPYSDEMALYPINKCA